MAGGDHDRDRNSAYSVHSVIQYSLSHNKEFGVHPKCKKSPFAMKGFKRGNVLICLSFEISCYVGLDRKRPTAAIVRGWGVIWQEVRGAWPKVV